MFSCGAKNKKNNENAAALLKNVDRNMLFNQSQKWLGLITDSGTLNKHRLNFADTLKLAFSSKNQLMVWFEYLLTHKNLRYPYFYSIKAEAHGLDRSFYHGEALKQLSSRLETTAWSVKGKIPHDSLALYLLLAADGMMGVYHDLSVGRVNPNYTGSIDVLPKRQCGSVLKLVVGDSAIAATSRAFPNFQPYHALQHEYERLLYSNESPQESETMLADSINRGDPISKYTAMLLGTKLRLHGVLHVADSILLRKTRYDDQFFIAVSNFQLKKGIEPTGLIDKATLKELNVSRRKMLNHLAANLERWRWLGPVNEKSRIWVNLAENKVYAWQEDTLELTMKVCSGKNRNKDYYQKLADSKKNKEIVPPDNLETPLMKAKLVNVVANPTWHVPRNIMVKEILPAIKQNPGSLAMHNYKLFNWKGEELDPYQIDWSTVTRENWKYRIEQGSGPENSLGKLLIQFPNAYSIFMHDTPSQYPFSLDNRHVSHGCVRMAEPLKMVEFITSFHKKDNYDEFLMAVGLEPERDEKKIKKYKEALKDSAKAEKLKPISNHYFKAEVPIPVYLVYFTAYPNQTGGITYTADGYDRDDKMLSNMYMPPKKKVVVKVQNSGSFSP